MERICLVALVLSAALAGGCRSYREADVGSSALEQVRDRLGAHARETNRDNRWRDFAESEYQQPADITAGRERRDRNTRRRQEAELLQDAGPLDLDTCLAFSIEFNDRIQEKRDAIRATGGDRLITKSRFLPLLVYSLDREESDIDNVTTTNDTHHSFRLSQTLLEFGKDNPDDVSLRDSERAALFAYEDTVRDVLSAARRRFFTILLRQQQMQERHKLLDEFRQRYEQVRQLELARRVLEVDVLTARLNMLNEEANINSLEREIFRQKIDLLQLIGFPVGVIDLGVRGEVEAFGIPLEDAVSIALRRSASVAKRRAEVEEQARTLREVLWELAPDIDLQATSKNGETVGGIELNSTDDTFAATAFAEAHPDGFDGFLATELELLDEADEGWAVALAVEVPIFEGFRRRGSYIRERARLSEKLHSLRNETDSVETGVRKAYQTVLERRTQVEILRETVSISKERLRVQEELKKLGKISDNELETFRDRFFRDQDSYFGQQISLVEAQEDLRAGMRFFESFENWGRRQAPGEIDGANSPVDEADGEGP